MENTIKSIEAKTVETKKDYLGVEYKRFNVPSKNLNIENRFHSVIEYVNDICDGKLIVTYEVGLKRQLTKKQKEKLIKNISLGIDSLFDNKSEIKFTSFTRVQSGCCSLTVKYNNK